MFLAQLRAILRASAYGPVKILLPMISHLTEIQQTRTLLERAKQELLAAQHPYDPQIQIGAMIEIPACAIALSMFKRHFDFLSIGTNDLIQYTLAIDRADSAVAHLYDPFHPAVLKLIAGVIQQAEQFNLPVSVCGEMAGDATMTQLLLGMGLREFSMHPSQLLDVKQEILQAEQGQLKERFQLLLHSSEPEDIYHA
jgi:phosphotransferase system enzyme I (PtsI)